MKTLTVEENIPLAPLTTFKIGGEARFFVRIKNALELKDAIEFAQKKSVPFFVLGGGSNLLVSDDGFPGLVIKNEILGITFSEVGNGEVEISAGAGEMWDQFVEKTVAKDLFGLENLSGIPGTVGASPVQNIGAYGTEVKDSVLSVEVFDPETGEIRTLNNRECKFAYRDSFFKKEAGKNLIITRVTFLLRKNAHANLEYKDIQRYIEENKITEISLQGIRSAILSIRSKKFPDLASFGTAGSFFKNPIISRERFEKLLVEFPKMQSFPFDERSVKIPAGWLLDVLCGFKGFRMGDAGVFENQALVLVNLGKASAEDVQKLAEHMSHTVEQKTGILLEFEVCSVK